MSLNFILFQYLSLSAFAQCSMKKEIASIQDPLILLKKTSQWTSLHQIDVYCYHEIGKHSFFLYLQHLNPDLLNQAIRFLNYSAQNVSRIEYIHKKYQKLNLLIQYLYQFNASFLQTNNKPEIYITDILDKNIPVSALPSAKKHLLALNRLMNQYYQQENKIIKSPSPNKFITIFEMLNKIEQMNVKDVQKIRHAYQSWQSYFAMISGKKNLNCQALEQALTHLKNTQKFLISVKDNHQTCKSFVNCLFRKKKYATCSQKMKNKNYSIAFDKKTWQHYYHKAINLCDQNEAFEISQIHQYVKNVYKKNNKKINKK